ncbi:MAG: hypothetical protein WCA20_33870 [Candidatus Sulfotelmatobacter sp.]
MSRTEEITSAETAKAQHLLELQMPRGEKDFVEIEKKVIDPLFTPNGLGLQLGGLPTGGGFSLGPQYVRRDLHRDNLVSDTYVVGSTKLWWRGQTSLEAPSLTNGTKLLLSRAIIRSPSIFNLRWAVPTISAAMTATGSMETDLRW